MVGESVGVDGIGHAGSGTILGAFGAAASAHNVDV
jgi:hypothetical protein